MTASLRGPGTKKARFFFGTNYAATKPGSSSNVPKRCHAMTPARAEALLCGGHCPFANWFPLTISQHLRFKSGEFMAALARKLGLVIPQLLTVVGMPLSNNPNSARKVGDAFGHAYTTVTGTKGDHVRTLHDTVLAYLFDDLKAAGIPFRGGPGKSTKITFSHCISQKLNRP